MASDVVETNDILSDNDDDTKKNKYFTFNIEKEEYGIEIEYVNEVIVMQKITKMPNMPEFFKGVINLRDKVIPVMDVRMLFKMATRDYDERTCILIVNANDTVSGLIVDEVSDVVNIPEDNIDPPPKVSDKPGSRFVKGMAKVGNEVKILLDIHNLIYDDEPESAPELR